MLMYLSFETLTSIQRDQLTYSAGTDRPGELCYNFTISNGHTQMNNSATTIPDRDFYGPALLDSFLSSSRQFFVLYPHVYISVFLIGYFMKNLII